MPKFQVRQIILNNAEVDAVNASADAREIPKYMAYTKAQFGEPQLGIAGGFYETVAEIDAPDLEGVFKVGNMGPESRIKRLARMHSVSVGDLVVDEAGVTHLVARFGFEEVA